MSNFAWVTLATNDSYSLGALVVAHSLKRVETAHKLVVLITPGVLDTMRSKLQDVFDLVQFVNVLDSKDTANLAVLKRPELGITFTKLHCWNLTQFDKCVFLDADVLVMQNCDELFEREELSAAADIGWPDIFSSGVFVYKPSVDTYGKLIQFAESVGSFDGADQGLLNQYFPDWSVGDSSKRLPFLYNTASTATYSYLPAFKHFGKNVKILHFIGEVKPWLQQFNSATRQVQTPNGFNHLQSFLQYWWDLFCENVHPVLSDTMSGIAGALANLSLGSERTAEQIAYEDQFRRANWESGHIDYLGQDSFDNIWKKIQGTIEAPPVEVVEQQERRRSRSRSKTPQREASPKAEQAAAVEPVAAAESVAPVAEAPVAEATVQKAAAPVVEAVAPVAAAAAAPIVAPSPPKPVVEEKKSSPAPAPEVVTAPVAPPKKKEGEKRRRK